MCCLAAAPFKPEKENLLLWQVMKEKLILITALLSASMPFALFQEETYAGKN